MRYLGGKSKIAHRLAAPILAARQGRPIWEPFCGGLGMTAAWGGGPLLLTDICRPLIAMYRAYAEGWRPPVVPFTAEERDTALLLPDTDPLKAFLRFGCGFGGNWAGGTTADGYDRNSGGKGGNAGPLAAQAARSLARTWATFDREPTFLVHDFTATGPDEMRGIARDSVIYRDAPYYGTEPYAAAGSAFDFDIYVSRVDDWARAGATVFVSEFEFPIGRVVLELDRARHVPGRGTVKERLYRI